MLYLLYSLMYWFSYALCIKLINSVYLSNFIFQIFTKRPAGNFMDTYFNMILDMLIQFLNTDSV